jgi:hypothetical protein
MSKDYNIDKQEINPEALRKFLGLCSDDLISRDEINKQIYAYVRDRKLCDETDNRIINPDKTLQKLFKLQEGETLDLNSLQYLSIYYPQSISNNNNEKKTVKFAEDVKENCNSNKDDDKGWSDLEESEEESVEEVKQVEIKKIDTLFNFEIIHNKKIPVIIPTSHSNHVEIIRNKKIPKFEDLDSTSIQDIEILRKKPMLFCFSNPLFEIIQNKIHIFTIIKIIF